MRTGPNEGGGGAIRVRTGCTAPDSFAPPPGGPITPGMEPIASVTSATTNHGRAPGWQAQVRVDYIVNKVSQTHRGMAEDEVAQAIQDQLRAVGVVPNGRMVAQYAIVISALPELPPRKD